MDRDDTFLLIEYPALVQNVEKAVSLLKIDEQAGKIELLPSSGEDWRPSISGEVKETCALLLTVKREGAHGEERRGEITGRVNRVGKFRKIIDFATFAPKEMNIDRSTLEMTRNCDLAGLKMLASHLADDEWRENEIGWHGVTALAPPRFTSSDFPFFKSIESVSSGPARGEPGKRKGKQAPWMRLFADPNPLEEAPKEIILRCKRLHRTHYESMVRLFQERPIWLKSALQHHLPDIGPTEVKTVLPAVAYFFSDGPWRCCWVRYGYDPRVEAEARLHQVVEIRAARIKSMISIFPASLQRAADSVSEQHVFDGNHILPNMSQFQYCDLTFDPIRAFLNDRRNMKDACDRREGWYVEGTISKVRALIKDRWLELVREADSKFYEKAMAVQSAQSTPKKGTTESAFSPDQVRDEGTENMQGEAEAIAEEGYQDYDDNSDYEIYE